LIIGVLLKKLPTDRLRPTDALSAGLNLSVGGKKALD
jgi:hypothetical protein